MSDGEDWLQDPLREKGKGLYHYRNLKNLPKEQQAQWNSFHFSTRLKLEGADYFCRQVLGAASMPDDQGVHLLAYKQLEWYLDAFFFELMAACDTLLQELNTVYAYDLQLKLEAVRWNKIKGKLPNELVKYVEGERRKDWCCEVQWYRNTTTHHRRVPIGSTKTWWGSNSLDSSHHVYMHYRDKEGNPKREEIGICKDYLNNMVRYINSVWEMMEQEFQ